MAKGLLQKSENSSYRKTKVESYVELLREGIWAGFGWSMGVTLGFVILTLILGFALKSLGGTPLVGSWIANIVEATQFQLSSRNTRINIPANSDY